jgi:hypothetical protein
MSILGSNLLRSLGSKPSGSNLNQALNGQLYYSQHTLFHPATVTASVVMLNTGIMQLTNTVFTEQPPTELVWLTKGSAADYEVEAVVVDQVLDFGPTGAGSWNNLGTNRTWYETRTDLGAEFCRVQYTIRKISRPVDLVTFTVEMQVTLEVFA